MIFVSSDQLMTWINAFIWPLTRILGLIAIAPFFGNSAIPIRVKVGFGVMLALIVAPTLNNLPHVEPVSIPGMMILAQQFVVGIAMGFTIQIIFASVDMAGNIISMAMGLGFASFFDPQTHGSTPALGQFLTLVATMLFLSLDLHLTLLSTLVDSFYTLPIGGEPGLQASIWFNLVHAASVIFSAGLQLALPVIAALLITNIALGILTRAAPQLNLFGIGFPITITVGFVMLFILLPYMAGPLERGFAMAIERASLH